MQIGACVRGFSVKSIEFFAKFFRFHQFDVNTANVGADPEVNDYVCGFSASFAPKATIVAFSAV